MEKKTGNHCILIGYKVGVTLRLYRDNGKENRSHYNIMGYIAGAVLGLYQDKWKRQLKLLYYDRVHIGGYIGGRWG